MIKNPPQIFPKYDILPFYLNFTVINQPGRGPHPPTVRPMVQTEPVVDVMPCSCAEWRRWIRPLVLVLYALLLVAVLPLCVWELQKDKVSLILYSHLNHGGVE